MELRIDVYAGTDEAVIVGEMLIKLGNLRREKDKDQDAEPGPVNETKVVTNETTQAISAALTSGETKAPRKTRKAAAAEVVAAVDPVATAAVAVAVPEPTPAPAPVVAAPVPPAAPAAPVIVAAGAWTKEALENAFRPHTRTNFVKAKGLLDQFKVARFRDLPEAQYQAFGEAVVLLGPAPTA